MEDKNVVLLKETGGPGNGRWLWSDLVEYLQL